MARSTRIALIGLLATLAVAFAAVGASGRTAAAPTMGKEPSIAGSPLEGHTLEGDRGAWNGTAPISYAYQWVRCDEIGNNCSNISGATTDKYKLVVADLGSTIRFRVTASNADGSKTGESNTTGVVSKENGAPTSTKPPVISGSSEVGALINTTTGSWVGATPITYSYQWQRCDQQGNACKNVGGATSSQYRVASADAGKTLRSKVTGKNSKGKSSAISAQTAVVVTGGATTTTPGGKVVNVADVPASERLVVDTVIFSPNPVTSRNASIEIRIRVKDTRGNLVRGAYVFCRSTPILTSTPTDAPTDSNGWVIYHVSPRSDFPLRTGYNVQFYVKAYKKGDPTLAGIYGSRLVQVATKTP
jgi:hypothetical protein